MAQRAATLAGKNNLNTRATTLKTIPAATAINAIEKSGPINLPLLMHNWSQSHLLFADGG